jgi:DNA polymerase-3 subunit gamma/tau
MSATGESYQVLARKYRPATFADLVGQEAMVRTLTNAFSADRIAQAFILTGIRGTGKTTTARIVAKGMNCIGPDGAGGPTTEPCGVCEHCVAIAAGNHMDVMEMDAASNTGVDDIRTSIIDTIAYAPASARYKIFVLDEVHMLSRNAFNALLKTLEEPPAHVKFIFATTDIQKVPVTILSRCQRFDLRRIEPEDMIAMLRRIVEAEGGAVDDGGLALLARASEGSARDAISLLDQALSQGALAEGPVTAEAVRAMLGLADRGRVLDLFDLVMKGDAAGALSELAAQYAEGADPAGVLRDLAEVCHWVSIAKISPEAADDPTVSPDERDRGREMADALPMRVLTRTWQMLLKALEEVSAAPNAMMAAEMALIRLTHVADLPPPEDLIRQLRDAAPAPPAPDTGRGARHGSAGPVAAAPPPASPAGTPHGAGPQAALQALPEDALARYARFEDVLDLVRARRDVKLLIEAETGIRLVRYRPGRIEFEPAPGAAPDLAQRLGARLQAWTGVRWAVSVVTSGGAPTVAERRDAARAEREAEARAHPLVQAVLDAFPDARIAAIRTPEETAASAAAEALPEIEDDLDDDWDPLEPG